MGLRKLVVSFLTASGWLAVMAASAVGQVLPTGPGRIEVFRVDVERAASIAAATATASVSSTGSNFTVIIDSTQKWRGGL